MTYGVSAFGKNAPHRQGHDCDGNSHHAGGQSTLRVHERWNRQQQAEGSARFASALRDARSARAQ